MRGQGRLRVRIPPVLRRWKPLIPRSKLSPKFIYRTFCPTFRSLQSFKNATNSHRFLRAEFPNVFVWTGGLDYFTSQERVLEAHGTSSGRHSGGSQVPARRARAPESAG